jgi:hypothetical protein
MDMNAPLIGLVLEPSSIPCRTISQNFQPRIGAKWRLSRTALSIATIGVICPDRGSKWACLIAEMVIKHQS